MSRSALDLYHWKNYFALYVLDLSYWKNYFYESWTNAIHSCGLRDDPHCVLDVDLNSGNALIC